MQLRTIALAWLCAAALAGCDGQRVARLEQGVSTEVDVRKPFGDPVTVTVEPGGTRTLEDPRPPEGWANGVIRVGPGGKVAATAKADDPRERARGGTQYGMAAERVPNRR